MTLDAKTGWECPRCGRVWAPWVASCESKHDARDVPIKKTPWPSTREASPPPLTTLGRNPYDVSWVRVSDPCGDRSIE